MKYQDDSDALEVFSFEHKAVGSFMLITAFENSICTKNMVLNKAMIYSYYKYVGSYKS